jgi:hypothetical protein
MSTNHCDPTNCPGGNCIGCLNGQLNCIDPRCYPNCTNCNTKTSSSNWIIITIILILLGVLLIMAFVIGYDWYKKSKKAAEPKNITVNKHIHTVKQPSIVLNSPPPIVISQRAEPTEYVSSVNYEPPRNRYVEPPINRYVEPPINRYVEPAINRYVEPAIDRYVEPAINYENDYFPKTEKVSYEGMNLSMDGIPSKNIFTEARNTPCDKR